MKPPTAEEAFGYGADAMRSRVVALLMMEGNLALAQKVMTLDMPRVQWPETFTRSSGESKDG